MAVPFTVIESDGICPRFFRCGHLYCGARYRAEVFGKITSWITSEGKCPACHANDVVRYVRVCPHCDNLIVAGMQVAIDYSSAIAQFVGEQGYEEVAGGVLVCAGCADVRGVARFGYWGANGYSDLEFEGL